MLVSNFSFDLPQELIAQSPASPRDTARLLSIGESLKDLKVKNIPDLIRPGDVLVINNTRVIPARLNGKKDSGTKIQITLLKPNVSNTWEALARPARKLNPGDRISFTSDFYCDVVAKNSSGQITLSFALTESELITSLDNYGIMPLPPYIKRKKNGELKDYKNYQTIFAKKPGAIAAPTAGLHFTPSLIKKIKQAGAKIVPVTLHVGAGTFLSIKVDYTRDHKMHAEWGEISASSATIINSAKKNAGRVIAIGTTALRLLEAAATVNNKIAPFSGETKIFITPGYQFKIVDALLTNFHLPCSTLFMLVSAFSGLDTMKSAYSHAISARYRFYSYGDACWLEGINGK
jgi:S-adenosylmethionine:tRNA ribosyltransferase-isomerase